MTGYEQAKKDIAAGIAEAHPLWILLNHEMDRDGYALKPKWEGPGQYQRVQYGEANVGVLVRIPCGQPSFKTR